MICLHVFSLKQAKQAQKGYTIPHWSAVLLLAIDIFDFPLFLKHKKEMVKTMPCSFNIYRFSQG